MMGDKFVLLVEGKDDEHVMYSLMQRHGLAIRPRVKNKEGIDNLLETLDVELAASDLEALGIIVDADTNARSRWHSIRQILEGSGYVNIPNNLDQNGIIINQLSMPRTGAWIMPDNNLNGMLEDFLQFLVPNRDDNLLLGIARWVVQNLPTQADLPHPERCYLTGQESKAIIYTWLAWQETPGKPFGLAITARFLDGDAPEALTLVDWMRRLYG